MYIRAVDNQLGSQTGRAEAERCPSQHRNCPYNELCSNIHEKKRL